MIISVDNVMLASKIMKIAENVPDISVSMMKELVLDAVADDMSKVFAFMKDDEVKGFILCSSERFNGERVCFIQLCYIEPEFPHIGHQLLNKVVEWSRKVGLSEIVMMSNRSPKAWERKYGFRMITKLFKKSI